VSFVISRKVSFIATQLAITGWFLRFAQDRSNYIQLGKDGFAKIKMGKVSLRYAWQD
jgi:hypothetical protein